MALLFTFRRLDRSDFVLLHDWLNRPHVAEWWDGPISLARVHKEWGADLASDAVSPMLACLEGVPVGYVHVYEVMRADPDWWTDETDPGARGIDQLLARPGDLGRGLGTEMVRQFVASIFDDPGVTKVQTDPSPANRRAIRCYEKVGFRRIGEMTTPDGAALLMVIHREEWSARVGSAG
jgi:aminoglycoside 6'-N-acetyltransferase-1b